MQKNSQTRNKSGKIEWPSSNQKLVWHSTCAYFFDETDGIFFKNGLFIYVKGQNTMTFAYVISLRGRRSKCLEIFDNLLIWDYNNRQMGGFMPIV